MKSLLRYVAYVAGAILIVAPVLHAQGRGGMGGGGMMGQRQEQTLLQGITLTDTQRDSIGKLSTANQAAMHQLMQSSSGPPDSTTRAQFQALRSQHFSDIRSVLTPDQQQVFDQNLAQLHSRMQQHMRSSGGSNP